MDTLFDFHFLRPLWLLALLLSPLLYWLLLSASGALRDWRRISDAELMGFLSIGSGRHSRKILPFLVVLIWVVATLAAAGPSFRQQAGGLYRQISATVIVFDLSRSMLCPDLKPARLDRARFKLIDLLARMDEGQVALVAFAGEPFIVSPLTDDANTIENLVTALTPDIMPAPGSDVAEALRMAQSLVSQVGSGEGDIILFTDQARSADAEIAEDLLASGIRTSVIGVGTPEGAPIPDGSGGVVRGRDGAIVIPRLDEQALQALAHAGGGVYHRLTAGYQDVDAVLATREQPLEGNFANTDLERARWLDDGPWLVLLLAPFVAMAFRRGVLMILCLGFFLPLRPAHASILEQMFLNREQRAERALAEDKFEEAARLAEDHIRRGNAHYRAGKFEAAELAYSRAGGVAGHYNRGNALARLEQLPAAIAAYEAALELDPEHDDARFNKQLLEKMLEQQQREQEQQEQESEQQQQQNSEQQQQSDEQDESDESEEAEQQEPSEEQPETEQQAEPEATEEELDQEQKQALEQWLRRIPDDPGGLLRRKFQLEYQRRGSPGPGNDEDW